MDVLAAASRLRVWGKGRLVDLDACASSAAGWGMWWLARYLAVSWGMRRRRPGSSAWPPSSSTIVSCPTVRRPAAVRRPRPVRNPRPSPGNTVAGGSDACPRHALPLRSHGRTQQEKPHSSSSRTPVVCSGAVVLLPDRIGFVIIACCSSKCMVSLILSVNLVWVPLGTLVL